MFKRILKRKIFAKSKKIELRFPMNGKIYFWEREDEEDVLRYLVGMNIFTRHLEKWVLENMFWWEPRSSELFLSVCLNETVSL